MKKSWIYTIIALIAASIAVGIAFLAGKAWDEYPATPDEDDQDDQDKKDDQDDKK